MMRPTSPNSETPDPARRKLVLWLVAWLLALGMTALPVLSVVTTATDEPGSTPTPTPWLPPILDKPEISENPSLAEAGSVLYWNICMACHGDRGQGLTDEFRLAAFGEDMNCWQSKCHASNHPPQGFQFPRLVPPVVGPGTLRGFLTAQDLQGYIQETMPWWDPGSLSDQDAWALTAFLLQENGVLEAEVVFNPKQAASAPVHLPIRSQAKEQSGVWIWVTLLGLAVAALVAGNALKEAAPALRQGKSAPRPNFFHHLHPPTIPHLQARWRYTLGAGGLAVFLCLVLIITGILEMYFYIPTPEQAGPSIQMITYLVPFGGLIRGMHFWAAQALVVVAAIHLLRVIFTGAFAAPRRFNYLIGLALLLLTLFLDFTGYVLRWDEGIRWALMVGTNLLKSIPWIGGQLYGFVIGGAQPGPATLIRFYAWHIFGLTLLMILFLAWHLFRVRRDGGVSAPPPEQRGDARRITRFELARREGLAALIALLALTLIAMLAAAPLDVPIQDAKITLAREVRAPWFFLWIQQLLRYGNAFWMGVMLPLGFLAALALLPYLFPKLPDSQKGAWFPRGGRLAQLLAASLALAWLLLTLLELLP